MCVFYFVWGLVRYGEGFFCLFLFAFGFCCGLLLLYFLGFFCLFFPLVAVDFGFCLFVCFLSGLLDFFLHM